MVLDLGGTNVRATVLDLHGPDGSDQDMLKSDAFRLATTSWLMLMTYSCPVASVSSGRCWTTEVDYTLGFIFAFPMEQTGDAKRTPHQVDQGVRLFRGRGPGCRQAARETRSARESALAVPRLAQAEGSAL